MLSVSEVAFELGLSINTVRRWLQEGRIKGAKPAGGRQWRIAESEMERLYAELVADANNRCGVVDGGKLVDATIAEKKAAWHGQKRGKRS